MQHSLVILCLLIGLQTQPIWFAHERCGWIYAVLHETEGRMWYSSQLLYSVLHKNKQWRHVLSRAMLIIIIYDRWNSVQVCYCFSCCTKRFDIFAFVSKLFFWVVAWWLPLNCCWAPCMCPAWRAFDASLAAVKLRNQCLFPVFLKEWETVSAAYILTLWKQTNKMAYFYKKIATIL